MVWRARQISGCSRHLPHHRAKPLLRYAKIGQDDVGEVRVGRHCSLDMFFETDQGISLQHGAGAVPAIQKGLVKRTIEIGKTGESILKRVRREARNWTPCGYL